MIIGYPHQGLCVCTGQPSKLTHPTDMFGFSCGELNEWNGITVDLRGKGGPFIKVHKPWMNQQAAPC